MRLIEVKKLRAPICLLFIILSGCSTVTPFVYKSGIPFDQSRFQEAPAIGISIYNGSIHGLIEVIKDDCKRFARRQQDFYDLSNEMMLTSNRLNISNKEELKRRYPDVKYILAVFEHEPELSRKHYKKVEEESGKYSAGGKQNKTETEYEYHSTTMAVRCEIMLFEMINCRLVAKTENIFKETKTEKRADFFPDHTLFGFIEDVLDAAGDDSDRYPRIDSIGPGGARAIFFYFLKHINYNGTIDFGYLFEQ